MPKFTSKKGANYYLFAADSSIGEIGGNPLPSFAFTKSELIRAHERYKREGSPRFETEADRETKLVKKHQEDLTVLKDTIHQLTTQHVDELSIKDKRFEVLRTHSDQSIEKLKDAESALTQTTKQIDQLTHQLNQQSKEIAKYHTLTFWQRLLFPFGGGN